MSEMEHWKGTIKEIIIPKDCDTWEKQVKFLQVAKHLNQDELYL